MYIVHGIHNTPNHMVYYLVCTTKLPGTTPKAGIQIHVYYVMLHQLVVLKYWLLLQVVFTL